MRLLSCGLLAALAALGNAQQLAFAQNDNPSYGNYAVGWPSSIIAFRFTPAAAMVVDAAQVFTGNQAPAAHTLEIRTRNAVTGLPDQTIAGPASWNVVHARCFQGAQFAQPVVLLANTDYFLVWSVTGMFPQHSVSADNYPGNVLTEARYSDGSTWHAQASVPAKFRLFAPYAAGTIQAFGTAKPGVYGDPAIGVTGWPAIGSVLDVWLDNAARVASTAPPNAALLIGLPLPGGVPFPIGTLYVTANVSVLATTRSHTSPFVGAVSTSFFVPNAPAAIGLPLSFQWAVFDAAAADGLAHSAAVTARLQ